MSYRSLKRVLGETSLERKCRFLFGGCLLVLITTSFWLYGRRTEHLVHLQNQKTGRLLVNNALLTMHWEEYNNDVLVNNKSFARGMAESLNKYEYEWRALIPDLPGNLVTEKNRPQDEFEAKLLERFSKPLPPGPEGNGLSLESNEHTRPEDGKSQQSATDDNEPPVEFAEHPNPKEGKYQYYQAIRAKATCYSSACHKPPPMSASIVPTGIKPGLGNSAPQSPGELMAVLEVTIPSKPTQDALDKNRAFMLAMAIITVFLAMVAAYVIVRYVIVKPLAHLRDVSDAISHGNIGLRAKIHTGDEFEALAVAFNRMLRHMVTAQEGLRHVNADLDAKVDELAQANMQLYEMNRLKSDFLATMSHELRTPLNSILGFSDVLGSIDSLDEKQKRYVTNIQTSGRLLLDMINNILDLAKLESGKTDVILSDFSIEQIIGAQCDMARPLTEKKNINLEYELEPGLPEMRQDQARLQQVLNNLLSNAIKFTPEGGRIKITAHRAPGEQIVLQVSDTGVGIAEEYIETIFQKFRQASSSPAEDDAMTREYTGTGLGLSIVKEICRLLGGEISVESQLGKGSTFTVRLPWVLEEQPRLDTPIDEQFEQFTNV